MNEIDWVQFHKQTQAMEEYLRHQRELETKRRSKLLFDITTYYENNR
jgi:hypothetical protein